MSELQWLQEGASLLAGNMSRLFSQEMSDRTGKMSSNIRNNFFLGSGVRHWKGLPRAGMESPSWRDLTALGDVGCGGLDSAGGMVGFDGLRGFCGSLGLLLSHLLHLPDPHSLSNLSFSTQVLQAPREEV